MKMDWFCAEFYLNQTMAEIHELIADIMNQLNLSTNHYHWARYSVSDHVMGFTIFTNRELMGVPSTVVFRKMKVIIEVSHAGVFLSENTLLKPHAINQLMDFVTQHSDAFAQH